MSTFSMEVHELLGLHTSVDRQTSLNVVEIDSKSRRRVERGLQQIVASQDRWVADTATALAEFAIKAQMQGFGIDRETPIKSLRCALESLSVKAD
jgi:hypothetical protein